MADLKTEIEDRLVKGEKTLQLFRAESLLDDKVQKHVRTETISIKSDSNFDVHEHIVTIVSNEPIERYIHIRAIIDDILAMQGTRLRKVIYNGFIVVERNGIYRASIRFIMVHNFEKGLSVGRDRNTTN